MHPQARLRNGTQAAVQANQKGIKYISHESSGEEKTAPAAEGRSDEGAAPRPPRAPHITQPPPCDGGDALSRP